MKPEDSLTELRETRWAYTQLSRHMPAVTDVYTALDVPGTDVNAGDRHVYIRLVLAVLGLTL